MTIAELSDESGVSREAIRSWISKGWLPAEKVLDGKRNMLIWYITDVEKARELAANARLERESLPTVYVAGECRVSENTIRAWAQDGLIPAKRVPSNRNVGYIYVFDREDLPAIKAFARQFGRRGRPTSDRYADADVAATTCVRCEYRPAVHGRVLCRRCREQSQAMREQLVRRVAR